MVEALTAASERLLAEAPEAVVVMSARWDVTGPFLVDDGRRHRTVTDYSGFGDPQCPNKSPLPGIAA